MDKTLFKLGSVQGENITPYRYSNRFRIGKTTGADRLCISVDEGQISVLLKLAFSIPEPYYVLYLLHTSRCGNQLGRYQSPAINFQTLNGFMTEVCEFLTDDARHDLWVHSPEAEAALVWDRHNLIYAYGPLEQFGAILKESLQEGQVNGPPYPHAHMYHAEYDDSERKLLRHFQWSRRPLIAGDEQFGR